MNDKSLDNDKALELLKQLSIQDFLDVGLDQVAYVKRDHDQNFSVYAANGSQISVMNSYDTAIAAIRVNDLFPVTLH